MKNLFETAQLGKLTLKNRLIRSATWEGIALPDGGVTDEAYKIYEELAKGGVGAIITGFTSVADNDQCFGGMMWLSRDELIPQYKKLVELIHAEHCPVIAQLALGGFYRNGRLTEPDEMTVDEIQSVVQMFTDAARRAKEAGFDGVQIHAAHFFFLSRFISPAVNHRTDAYGDPAGFLRNINDHIPTHDQNKLIFIEKTGHTYQMKHQEVADDILRLVQDWREA